jgi:hypothetical protein
LTRVVQLETKGFSANYQNDIIDDIEHVFTMYITMFMSCLALNPKSIVHRACLCRPFAVPSQTGMINSDYRLSTHRDCISETPAWWHHMQRFFLFIRPHFLSSASRHGIQIIGFPSALVSGVVPANHHASRPGTRLICEQYVLTPRGYIICCRCGIPNLGIRVRNSQLHTYFFLSIAKLTNQCTALTTNHRLFLPESPSPSFMTLC